jgi:hypothetical protein
MRVTKKKKKITQRYIVLPDTHGDLVDRPALECVLQAIELIKPTGIIHLGDLGEWISVNHHRHKRTRTPDPCEVAVGIRHDARMVRKYILDPLDRACEKAGVKIKHMLTGNHDIWLDRFVETNPDYADTPFDEATGYQFKQIFDWRKRGWQVLPCGKLLKIGKLNFYHGHLYGGIHHARNHLLRMGVNIVYGHWHDYQAMHVTHADGPKGAYSLGCLKDMTPEANTWLNKRPVNWAHMFGVVDFYAGGLFSVHAVPIINGQCTLIGTDIVIDGRKPRPLVPITRTKSNFQKPRG